MEFAEVCSEEDLRRKGKVLVRVDNREVAIFYSADQVYAIGNKCPHHGAPLVFGKVCGSIVSDGPRQFALEKDGGVVACPWHKREIDLATGQFTADPTMRVPIYAVKIENGAVLVGNRVTACSAQQPITAERK